MILLKMVIIYLCYNIYMDVVSDIQVLENIEVVENDIKDCNTKSQRVNCSAIYDAIMSSLKVMYDLIFMCCARGPVKGHPP